MSQKNERLQVLVDLLPVSQTIGDIGTDHAYLPIAAVQQHKTQFAYAADINQKPLNQAQKNIAYVKLNEQIKTVLSDGLTYFNENKVELDVAVIAGLGSTTIIKILQQDSNLIKSYLVCSNTDAWPIRQFVQQQNWFLETEVFLVDNQRNYWVLQISKTIGKKVLTDFDLFVGTSQKLLENPAYLTYLKKLYEQHLAILKVSQDWEKNRQLEKYNQEILKVI